ncbi:MAG: DUF7523 family protein [Halodesulfurarchaeum sp.]
MDSIAARTRRAVDRTPYVRQALRAGVLNYTAAARRLDVEGEPDAVASALRRYEADLPPLDREDRSVRVRMDRSPDERLLSVAGRDLDGEDRTALTLSGALDPGTFGRAVAALHASSLPVSGAAYAEGRAVVLVPGADGSAALRIVESVVTS